MIKLITSTWTTEDGKNLTTYTLEGNTYPVKDKIKELGFRWGIPADITNLLGYDVSNDPMFGKNKKWSVTFSANEDKTEWIEMVCDELEAVLVDNNDPRREEESRSHYDVDFDQEGNAYVHYMLMECGQPIEMVEQMQTIDIKQIVYSIYDMIESSKSLKQAVLDNPNYNWSNLVKMGVQKLLKNMAEENKEYVAKTIGENDMTVTVVKDVMLKAYKEQQ